MISETREIYLPFLRSRGKTKFLFGRYLVATFEMSCIVSGTLSYTLPFILA